MRVIRSIPVWLLAATVSLMGSGRALHSASDAHSHLRIADGRSCEHGHPGSPTKDPGEHKHCPVCHLIAQSSTAAFAPALMLVDRADAPVERCWQVRIQPVVEDFASPIGARAPPAI